MLLLPDEKQLYMTIVFIMDLQQVGNFDHSRTTSDFEKTAVYSKNTDSQCRICRRNRTTTKIGR